MLIGLVGLIWFIAEKTLRKFGSTILDLFVVQVWPKMGVRLPILALVGVGRARQKPGERFGTVVDGVVFLEN